MNTPEPYVTYLLNGLVTSWLWEVARYESLLHYDFIFDYNTVAMLDRFLIICVPSETCMNILSSWYKVCYFNVTMSPYYLMTTFPDF